MRQQPWVGGGGTKNNEGVNPAFDLDDRGRKLISINFQFSIETMTFLAMLLCQRRL